MRGEAHGLHPHHGAGARRRPRRARQGDRPAQSPRLVELPLLPLLRAGLELSALRRRARAAPRRRLSRLPPLRPPRARAGALRRVRLDVGRAPRRRHRAPAARARERARRRRLPGLPARRRRASAREAARRGALLRRFEAADCGVLIGTQMVAKGHDFPDVTLGVVLDADATLRFPDFRAEERTFALIAQLAGRVGRGTRRARARADDRTAGASDRPRRRHDSDGFLAGELDRRRGARLPALLAPDQDRLLGRRALRRARAAASAVRARLLGRSRATGEGARLGARARRRCFACAAASAQVLVVKAAERRSAVRGRGRGCRQRRRRAGTPG